jgi:hypothetical protein
MRTIETGLDKRARQSAQHRPGLRRQVVPARHLVLLLPLLLVLALREIDYVSCSRVLVERLLSMQDERLGLGRAIVGCHRVLSLALGLGRSRRLLWVQPYRDRGPETRVT